MHITIYSTSICPSCQALTSWLDSIGVSYQKKITDTDPLVMNEFMSVNEGMIGVPFSVLTADDSTITKISGYDQKKFKRALGL